MNPMFAPTLGVPPSPGSVPPSPAPKKTARKPKEPKIGPDGQPIVKVRKPREPKLGPDGQPIVKPKKPKEPKLGPDGQPIVKAKKPKEPKLGPDGQPIPKAPRQKKPVELGPDGQPIKKPRKRKEPPADGAEPPKRKKAKAEDDPNAPPKKPRKKKATDAEQVMGMGMDELVGLVKKEIVAAEENLEGVGVDDDEFMYQEGDAPRRAPAAPRLTEEGDDEGEDDDDSDDESDSHDEQPSEDDENDESDEEQMYNNARIQQQTEMRHIIDQFTPEQQDRYESFRRSRFPTAQIKRIMGQVAGVTVGQQTAIVMAGCTKLFVGELVETARTVQEEWANASGMTDSSVVLGPVSPAHIREAYRRLKEAGKVPYEKKERLFKR